MTCLLYSIYPTAIGFLFPPVLTDPVLSVSAALCGDFNKLNLSENSSPRIPSLSLEETRIKDSKLPATTFELLVRA